MKTTRHTPFIAWSLLAGLLTCAATATAQQPPSVAPAVAPPSQAGSVLAPPVPTGTPGAVTVLQQTIDNQQNGAPPAVQVAPSNVAPSSFGDESTLLREVAKAQARLSLMTLMSQIEKNQMEMERERIKFAEEKRDSENKSNSGPSSAPSAGGPSSSPALPAAPIEPPVPMPIVRSVYSFDGTTFIELSVNGSKIVVSPGATLSTGDKVISASQNSVVLSRKGKKSTLQIGAEPPAAAGAPIPGM